MKKLFFYIFLFAANCCLAQDSLFYQSAEWSPDGKRICTQVIGKTGSGFNSDGYIINVQERKVEAKIPGALLPGWSADGSSIVYARKNTASKGTEICLMKIVTHDSVRLTHDTSWNSGPVFSPDGKRISFSSDRDGRNKLYMMNADGSNIQKLSFDTASDYNPSWSPKGDKIVYYKERGDRKDKVYMVDIATGKEIKVTDDTLHNTFPGWLPDGKSINYTRSDLSGTTRVTQIAFIDTDGTHGRLIPNTAGCFFSRASPNGKKLAIIKGHWPLSDIYILNIDGSAPTCVTCGLLLK